MSRPWFRPRLISLSMRQRWISCRTVKRSYSRGSARARFQGRFIPEGAGGECCVPRCAPGFQDLLKRFDLTAASVLLDDRARVISRQVRLQGPLHAITETVLSIHTPIPTDAAFWEAQTQLAMGHNQTAKGMLRFEKDKGSTALPGGLVRVKVSGVLKAEGAIVGNFIKDGRYTVSGVQHYDPKSREWKKATWTVDVSNELANAAGVTVAQAKGKMLVESGAVSARSANRRVLTHRSANSRFLHTIFATREPRAFDKPSDAVHMSYGGKLRPRFGSWVISVLLGDPAAFER